MNVLVVIDMQNDFIDGALGTEEAAAIVPKVIRKIQDFEGRVFFTRDTHEEDYLDTQEGRKLPIKHCIKGTDGWQIRTEIDALRREPAIDKPSFGSEELGQTLRELDHNLREQGDGGIETITLIGLCTDICVISNAMILKAVFPEIPIIVDSECCAGVTVETHKNALEAMKICQIDVR